MRRAAPARWLARRMQILVPPAGGRLLILSYHLVGAGTDSPVDLALPIFRRQLDELEAGGRALPFATALARLRQGTLPREAPTVSLTFDDAYENFSRVVWPELLARRLPATLFVPVGFVTGERPPPLRGADLPAASWAQLRDMCGEGLAVGSHGFRHEDLRRFPADLLDDDLKRSREQLEDGLGGPVDTFCYPRGLWSKRCEGPVRRHFLQAVVGGGRAVSGTGFHPLRLCRVPIRRDMPTSLAPVLISRVWIEEWLADQIRRRLV